MADGSVLLCREYFLRPQTTPSNEQMGFCKYIPVVHSYLERIRFKPRTDHNSPSYVMHLAGTTSKHVQWCRELSEIKFDVVH